MPDTGRNFNRIIEVGVSGGRHSFQIVGGVRLVYAGFFQKVRRLVVGDRGLCLRRVDSYGEIPFYVYFCSFVTAVTPL